MGIFDRAKEKATEAAKEFAADHHDSIERAVEKVAETADERTGGKHTEQIARGADAVQQRLDDLGDRDDATTPPAP